jgi:glycosyltransferase involved in cell wall biosynthesis
MINLLDKDENIICIGNNIDLTGVINHGIYKIDELPDLMEKYLIDVVFIPSICAETFSFTTAEAVAMNIPVACFNIGALPERINGYANGILINKIDANTAINEIRKFIKNIKNPV